MSASLRSMLVAVVLCGLVCPQLLARADALDDGCPGEMTLLEGPTTGARNHDDDKADKDDKDDKDNADVVAVEVIVPCAVVDSGALGADCHDAAFYVVNQSGTLLCRVDIAMFASQATSTSIETAAPAAPTSTSSAIAAAVPTPAPHFRIPRQGIIELGAAHGPSTLGPGLDLPSFSPRPS